MPQLKIDNFFSETKNVEKEMLNNIERRLKRTETQVLDYNIKI